MKREFGIGWILVPSLLMAGCATTLGSNAKEEDSLKTQVASLESQVGQLNARVEELSKQQTAEAQPQSAPASLAEKNRSTKTAALSPRQIQLALKTAGFYTGPVDGKLGPQTKEAVVAFQQSKGLTPDGRVGTKTATALARFLEK